jgi:hypothetical protein
MRKPFLPTAATRVEEVLERLPGAARAFVQRRTDCVGCHLARFCTLADVAEAYDLSLESLLQDLSSVSPSKSVDRPADRRDKETPWK